MFVLITDKNKFLSLAYGRSNEVAVSNKFGANVLSIFSFKKHAFVDRVLILMLVSIKQSVGVQELSQTINIY